MKKIVTLNESQLVHLVRKVIRETQELEIQPDETDLGLTTGDLQSAAQKMIVPIEIQQEVNKNEPLKERLRNELYSTIDNYCKTGRGNSIIGFLKNTIREIREDLRTAKRKRRQEKKTSKMGGEEQLQEGLGTFLVLGILGMAAFLGLCILIVKLLDGPDPCKKWAKAQRRMPGFR